eukprot:UN15203
MVQLVLSLFESLVSQIHSLRLVLLFDTKFSY